MDIYSLPLNPHLYTESNYKLDMVPDQTRFNLMAWTSRCRGQHSIGREVSALRIAET